MLWVLVVALIGISIACATAVISWHQVALLRGALAQCDANFQRGDLELQSLRDKRADTDLQLKRLAMTVTELLLSRETAASAAAAGPSDAAAQPPAPAEAEVQSADRARQRAEALTGLRQWADGHLTAAAAEAARSARLLQDLEQYAIATLADGTSAQGLPILTCGLYAQQPSVIDVGPELVEGLRSAVDARLMYQQPHGPSGIRFYLRWPTTDPRAQLRSLLDAVRVGQGPASPPGTAELDALFCALYDGGPAVLRLGPLVVARTAAGMSAGFAPPEWDGLDATQFETDDAWAHHDLLAYVGIADSISMTWWERPQAA
jgi:hypothetical protein